MTSTIRLQSAKNLSIQCQQLDAATTSRQFYTLVSEFQYCVACHFQNSCRRMTTYSRRCCYMSSGALRPSASTGSIRLSETQTAVQIVLYINLIFCTCPSLSYFFVLRFCSMKLWAFLSEINDWLFDLLLSTGRLCMGLHYSIWNKSVMCPCDMSMQTVVENVLLRTMMNTTHAAPLWYFILFWRRCNCKCFTSYKYFTLLVAQTTNTNISGLGCHIAISGCWSLSQSFGDTFFDVAMVGKLDFVTWITISLIPDLFCHIRQHDLKISPV